MIPESNDSLSFGIQSSISNTILFGLTVLSAIDLDNESFVPANEIANVVSDRFLSDKLLPIDLSIANTIPENRFGLGLIGAQSARDGDCLLIGSTHEMPLSP